MAYWPINTSNSVISLKLAKCNFVLGETGFQKAIASGEMTEDMNDVANALRGINPLDEEVVEAGGSMYFVNAGLPGTNEQLILRYLGVYVTGISFLSGSRILRLEFAVMFHAAVSGIQGYPDLREGVVMFHDDMRRIALELSENISRNERRTAPPAPEFFDVRRPETIEKEAIEAIIRGAKPGENL